MNDRIKCRKCNDNYYFSDGSQCKCVDKGGVNYDPRCDEEMFGI